ncbi:MAG: class I SAM-dependent RNA methyltransferase [Clostridia bacterium]|nr:class I SAM-dependent RNA methyltransferase [Clostridia bacterium]
MEKLTLLATAAFGLEGVAARELKQLGYEQAQAENGGARFEGTLLDAFKANLRLRTADRVQIVLAEAECRSFEALFQLVNGLPWEKWLTPDMAIHVSGNCARSALMSVRDCQAIAKKAIIERLKARTRASYFPETGPVCPVLVRLHGDIARIAIDTSGDALNRRGYRTWNGEAPIRETLAAALVELSPWRPGQRLHDPCCGTGTLMIEAALIQTNTAPGLNRDFVCEGFRGFPSAEAKTLRGEARSARTGDALDNITGSDIDAEALTLAGRHCRQAGLGGKLRLTQTPLEKLEVEGEEGVFLCNPPYGVRLSDQKACQRLYGELRRLQDRHPGWTLCAISSDPAFERAYGRRADRKRRMYNGRLECEFLTFRPR